MLLNPYRFSSASPVGDPYWSNVLCLLNGAAAEGIVDAKGRTLSLFGSPVIVTNDPDFPDGAIYLDGTSYIRYEDNPSLWLILDSDFSIEFDYKPIQRVCNYPTIVGGIAVFSTSNNGFSIYDRHAGSPSKFTYALSGQFPYQESSVIPTNGTKYSIQISYSSADNYIRFFVNGVLQAQRIRTSILAVNGNYLFLGRQGDHADTYIKGLIGRFRVTKGVARNTANYTPSTAPFPIT